MKNIINIRKCCANITSQSVSYTHLEIGEERQIRVVGSIGQEEVNDRVTLTSSNPKVAVIDEAGKLKAIGLGTTTITAAVKEDPAKRKVTMSVKVVARQVGEIRITMKTTNPLVSSIEENGILKQLTLDARDVRNIKNGIELEPVSYTHLDVYKRQPLSWD